MSKVALVADSIACLPREMVERYGIEIVSPNIYFDGQIYRDWIDISPSDAYRLLEKAPDLFSTSAPPPAAFVEAYRKVGVDAEAVLVITLSSKVSTVYNAAVAARDLVQGELNRVRIEVLDSMTATGAEGFVVLAAARAVENGKGLDGALGAAKAAMHKVDLLFVLETIRHAYRTGRIPKIATQLGAWLSVRPMFTWENGVARLIGVTRNKEKGLNQLLEEMHRRTGRKPVHVAVHHAGAPEEGERLRSRVQQEFNCVELWVTEMSPIMGYSTGTGALGLAFYAEE